MFAHIKLPVLSEHLMPWLETVCIPAFNDVHFHSTFLFAEVSV